MLSDMIKRGNRLLRQPSNTRGPQFPVVLALLTLVIVSLVLLFGKIGHRSSSIMELENQKWDSFNSLVQFDPTVEVRNETDLIWQIPESPKAVLFLAHGCNGRALNFWDKSLKCPDCVGLPEERLITLQALSRRYAVIAISSKGVCWSLGEERWIVKNTIQWWVAKQKLEKLPMFALGASSGGYFVSVLATAVRFRAIALMIAEGVFSHLDIKKDYPPTIFVHMPKDENRKQKIEKYLVSMSKKGIEVEEVQCMEFPLTPELFAKRIPDLDITLSEKLFNLFQEKGFIDKNGYMRDDGRAIPWRTALDEKNIPLPDQSLVNHIQEEMNLAFAYHEMTSLQSQQIFDWFESHM